MPTLQLTDEQVIELVKQLPLDQQRQVYEYLLLQRWPSPAAQAAYFEEGARVAARERGRDWDAMTEDEREEFIDRLRDDGMLITDLEDEPNDEDEALTDEEIEALEAENEAWFREHPQPLRLSEAVSQDREGR